MRCEGRYRLVCPELDLDVVIKELLLVALVTVPAGGRQCPGMGEVKLVESVELALPGLGWLGNT